MSRLRITPRAVTAGDARPKNETGNVDSEGYEIDAIDAFLDRVVPNANPDPASGCASGLTLADRLGSDGIDDTFVEVSGNVRVCFRCGSSCRPNRPRRARSAAALIRAERYPAVGFAAVGLAGVCTSGSSMSGLNSRSM